MSRLSAESFEHLLRDARAADPEAMASLLEQCWRYLLFRARRGLPGDVQAKASPSDLAQDSLVEAHGSFGAFRGETRQELLAWLRQILERNLANLLRAFRRTRKRELAREGWRVRGDAPAPLGPQHLSGHEPSPSDQVGRNENEQRTQQAIRRLPYCKLHQYRWYEQLQ